MKSILIISEPDDIHASAVAWALSEMNQNPYLWFIPDFPSLQSISIGNLNTKPNIKIRGVDIDFEKNAIDAVWMRRFYPPFMPSGLAKADQVFAKREYMSTIHSTLSILKQMCSHWVNPFGTGWIDNKAVQLHIASQLGFQVPKTLISNEPKEIRSFLAAQKEAIYKPFGPMTWQSEKEVRRGETTMIFPDCPLDDQTLSVCPGIFQSYIDKAYEIRIIVFGEKIFAIALYSQTKQKTIDWRLPLYATEFPTAIISLPEEIYKKIIAFMEKSNLLFGCFDFIVTNEGEWVFLEINPMGQFLWVEELHPELPLLDAFCHLLINDLNESSIKNKPVSFLKFRDEIWSGKRDALIANHIIPENNFLVFEEC